MSRFNDLPERLRAAAQDISGKTKLTTGDWLTFSNLFEDAAFKIEALTRECDDWADTAGTATANLHLMRQGQSPEQDEDAPIGAVLS